MEGKDIWIRERIIPDFEQALKAKKLLRAKKTHFQYIEIYETGLFGKVLVLDGAVQVTEKDEHCYHEMLVGLPLILHGKVRKAAIIGGGDGASFKRLLSFPVESGWMCELDPEVVEVCREHLKELSAGAFSDSRANIVFEDGFKFLSRHTNEFDAIIIDSTDPVGEAEKLISDEFYSLVKKALKSDGIFSCQSGSPWLQPREASAINNRLKRYFANVFPYLGHVPSYPGGLWLYTLASDRVTPHKISTAEIERRTKTSNLEFKYLTPILAKSCFILPECIRKAVEGGVW